MMQQTFIVKVYSGSNSYRTANTKDFFRVGCKKYTTALKYLKNWVMQARERDLRFMTVFFKDDSMCEIIATPDGYNEEYIAASGRINDLM